MAAGNDGVRAEDDSGDEGMVECRDVSNGRRQQTGGWSSPARKLQYEVSSMLKMKEKV